MNTPYVNAYQRRLAARKARTRAAYLRRQEWKRIREERRKEAAEQAAQDAADHAREIDPGQD